MLDRCWDKMVGTAIRAGEMIKSASDIKVVEGDPHWHPHTDIDLKVNAMIKEALLPCLGNEAGWLSEEDADKKDRLNKDWVFIVDPIDGTHSLMKGLTDAVVSIALTYKGKSVAGVIYNGFTGEMWIAKKGEGALLNGIKISVRNDQDVERALFLVSSSEYERGLLKALDGRVRYAPRGSIAYKIALVAAGRGHAHMTIYPRSEWDVAAAAIILEEAGGVISDSFGKELMFNQETPIFKGIIASTPQFFDYTKELIKVLRNYRH